MSRGQDGTETAERLLTAAGEVFAEMGYRAATLRDICRRAQANIAAANYHFRDKQQLYTAVLDQAVRASGGELDSLGDKSAETPEERLRDFIGKMLHSLLGSERPVRLLRLVMHEMVEPTHALDVVVEKVARPIREVLSAIVAELLGAAADTPMVRDCVSSVLAQCTSYHHAEVFIQRLDLLNLHDAATIEHLAEHIFQFSLGGIRAMAADCHGKSEGKDLNP